MLLFAVCSHCRAVIEERNILDLAQFFGWVCPKCGAKNERVNGGETVEADYEEGDEIEITVEVRDANDDDLKGNLLEGI